MGFWRYLLAQVCAASWCTSNPGFAVFMCPLSPGSEAAMEAAASLAPIYPKVFSGHMVPRLEEELQSGRSGSLGRGFGLKPIPSLFGFYQAFLAVPCGVGWQLSLGVPGTTVVLAVPGD